MGMAVEAYFYFLVDTVCVWLTPISPLPLPPSRSHITALHIVGDSPYHSCCRVISQYRASPPQTQFSVSPVESQFLRAYADFKVTWEPCILEVVLSLLQGSKNPRLQGSQQKMLLICTPNKFPSNILSLSLKKVKCLKS